MIPQLKQVKQQDGAENNKTTRFNSFYIWHVKWFEGESRPQKRGFVSVQAERVGFVHLVSTDFQ